MGAAAPLGIVNLSEAEPGWNWLAGHVSTDRTLAWGAATTQLVEVPAWLPKPASWRRAIAGKRAADLLKAEDAILVSHGPRLTMYGAMALAATRKRRRHLAYSFNFTELPTGQVRRWMANSFKDVDRFVCFSTMERELYATHFKLPIDRIDMIHWAAGAPKFDPAMPREIEGDYICALGSQGRDYASLITAMRALPAIKLVLVATPASVAGQTLPRNVEIRYNIAPARATNILLNSRLSVVPLRDSEVPCGHVTIVSAMHSGKPTIVTASSGVADYVQNGVNALTVPPRDPEALAGAIERLWNDAEDSARLARAAKEFARLNCSEQAAIDYFNRYLERVR